MDLGKELLTRTLGKNYSKMFHPVGTKAFHVLAALEENVFEFAMQQKFEDALPTLNCISDIVAIVANDGGYQFTDYPTFTTRVDWGGHPNKFITGIVF